MNTRLKTLPSARPSKRYPRGLAALALGLAIAAPAVPATVLQTFDAPGTAFQTTTSLDAFASGPRTGPTVVGGGPTGNFLRLIDFRDKFGRYRTGLGFDQTVTDPVDRVEASFDFRVTCAGARAGFSGGGCADGFSINFLNTDVSGTSGAVPFDENGFGQTFETPPDPEIVATDAFSVGFRTFSTGLPGGNSMLATFDNAVIPGVGSSSIPFGEIDLATGLNSSFGAFHRADLTLDLGPAPTLSLLITDGTDGSTFLAYDNIDLSGAALSPYDMRVNFGARVGDASSTIDLDNIAVTFRSIQSVPEPGTVVLLAAAMLLLGGAWRGGARVNAGASRHAACE